MNMAYPALTRLPDTEHLHICLLHGDVDPLFHVRQCFTLPSSERLVSAAGQADHWITGSLASAPIAASAYPYHLSHALQQLGQVRPVNSCSALRPCCTCHHTAPSWICSSPHLSRAV